MRLIIILTLVALFFSTGVYSAEPSFTDREAKAFIEKLWSNIPWIVFLGPMSVVEDRTLGVSMSLTDPSDVRISESYYKTYLQTEEKIGIIKISVVKDFESRDGDWGDHMARTLGGLKRKILVEKTDVGAALAKKEGLEQTFTAFAGFPKLVLRTSGTVTVDKIVKNEGKQIGIDNYRVIMAGYTEEWSPEYKHRQESVTGKKLSEKRKTIMLIKFDPFSSKWKLVTFDVANRGEDFSTNYVSRALSMIEK